MVLCATVCVGGRLLVNDEDATGVAEGCVDGRLLVKDEDVVAEGCRLEAIDDTIVDAEQSMTVES
jgi:hypothetical protein